MLRKYSIIAFFIAAVEIVNNIAAIIIIALYKPAFSLKKCAYHYGYSGGCNILIVAAVISILLSVRIKDTIYIIYYFHKLSFSVL